MSARLEFIDNARKEIHRLWTVRIAMFFFVLNGAVVGLAAFVDVFNPWLFMGLNIAGYALIGVMRLLKQAPEEAPIIEEPKP